MRAYLAIALCLVSASVRAQTAPARLTASALGPTVTASWNANTDGVTTGYQLSYGTMAGGPYPTIVDVGSATTQVVQGLAPGVPYFFIVQAYNAAKALGPASNQATFTLPVPSTTAPCTYIVPGSTTMDTRPIGTAIQGFNPMAGQAQRIGDLRSWGWRVEWQLDAASGRLFLMAWCQGL